MYMWTARIIVALTVLATAVLPVRAQSLIDKNFQAYSKLLAPEKLYLQTDREVYCVGDTIWFKGYLRNASDSSEYKECNYIYVELMSSLYEMNYAIGEMQNVEKVRFRSKIKRDSEGEFHGFLVIPEKVSTGISTVRAYSYWMRNLEPQLLFFKNIEVRNPVMDDYVQNMVKNKELDAYKYHDMGVENPFGFKKRKKISAIDIQFLPESGRYLSDRPCTFGIRTVADDGFGIASRGEIVADGKRLTEYQTNGDGLGKVSVTVPAGVRNIYAIADNVEVADKKFKFPLPARNCVHISVVAGADSIVIAAADNLEKNILQKKIIVHNCNGIALSRDYCRGMSFSLDASLLKDGINNVSVVDTTGHVYAQRAFFVYPKHSLSAEFEFDKEQYECHDKVSGKFALKNDNGEPVCADLSVSVTDDIFAPFCENSYNAVSYHYLGSEYTAHIDRPNRYFCDTVPLQQRMDGLDMVMLTYGWKYYDTQKVLAADITKYEFGREYTQSISGKVDKWFGIDGKKSMVSFVAPRINLTQVIELEPTGRFNLNGLDFPDSVRFLIASTNMKGDAARIPIITQETFAPNPYTYPEYMVNTKYDVEYKKLALPEYYDLEGDPAYVIQPSFVKDYGRRKYDGLSPIPQWAFKPNQLKVIAELQPYNAYTLMDFLYTVYPGLYKYDEKLCCIRPDSGHHRPYIPVILYVNQMQEQSHEILYSLMVEDVEAVAVLERSDAAPFQDAFADASSYLFPITVVFIKTRWPDRVPGNITGHNPLGWQLPAKMYQPEYTPEEKNIKDHRMRATLYWNPSFGTSEDGENGMSFFTSSHKCPMTVNIEGFTSDGKPVSFRTTVNGQEDARTHNSVSVNTQGETE